jgi:hypothetical protein
MIHALNCLVLAEDLSGHGNTIRRDVQTLDTPHGC